MESSFDKLGHRIFRVLPNGARQPHWFYNRLERLSIKDRARSDHRNHIQFLRGIIFKRTFRVEVPYKFYLFAWRRLFCLQKITKGITQSAMTPCF